MSIYPKDWPRCPACGDHALDGHITCGRATCDEGEARRARGGTTSMERSTGNRKYLREEDCEDNDEGA